jgi:hypothetical protein
MTAVEWFEKELQKNFDIEGVQPLYDDILYKALEMEKKDIIHFGAICCIKTAEKKPWTLEELYNKTFKK